jgi:hypothetical protein
VRHGDPARASEVPAVEPVSPDVAAQIVEYIADYGETLLPLPAQTWDTSVTLWQRDYWDVLVDLWTEPGRRSDLVLHVEVREAGDSYRFRVGLVYVP